MRVGIDATPLLRARTGVAVITEMVMDCLRAAGHEIAPLVSAWRVIKDRPPRQIARARLNWLPYLLNPLFLDRLRWPRAETLLGPIDAFIATNYAILPSRTAATVALVHDIGRVVRPDLYGRRQVTRFRFLIGRCCRMADRIVVPTAAVADDIVRCGLMRPGRIHVVPWSVRAPRGGAAPLPLPAGAPLMLSVATLDRRKNLDTLLRAFASMADRCPHHLVLAGGRGSAARQLADAVRGSPAAGRVHLVGHVGTDTMATLYRRADIAVCPSLYEGFGLPVVEAMAHGCPVLASDIPAHREVGGEAIRLVPPSDERAMADGLVDLARDAEARRQLRELGYSRSRAFSWRNTQTSLAAALAV